MKLERILPAFCLAFLAVHWLNQWHGTYGLMFDEAQYWFWAKHPAWGYYSKPPVIGWLIGLSTAIFGDGVFGVKMLSPLLLLLTGLTLHATARRLDYPPRTAAWVLLTYLTLPFVTGNATFFTTDVPLQLCWSIALYAVVMALRANKPSYWLLAGAAAGIGLLSKYTMVAFAASSFLALLLTPDSRRQLRSIWPWLGGILAGLLLVPNLMWNAHHHFVTFTHTNDNVFSKQIEIYPEDMLSFIGAQFGVFGPILLVTLLLSLRHVRRSDATALLHCFIWPLTIAGIIVSLLAGAQAHWIAPVYLAGTLIVVPWLLQRRSRLLAASLALHIMLLVLFYLAPFVTPSLKHDPLARLFVWDRLATQLEPLIAQYPDAVLMSNERKITASFTYQLRDIRGYSEPVYKWDPKGLVWDHFDMLTHQKDFTGKRLLLVLRHTATSNDKIPADAVLLQQPIVEGYKFDVYLLPTGANLHYEPL
jgi:hypothetical protein